MRTPLAGTGNKPLLVPPALISPFPLLFQETARLARCKGHTGGIQPASQSPPRFLKWEAGDIQ
ncbi:hypothetical protein [Kamptonema formosum]|uniref:hypothetical protein n=1 Tax=Kamptonema formosum TaxID=331992 RepID=UPI000369CFFA|nr:hypothetical protein [Oscillatoria sp. PCC 10802]